MKLENKVLKVIEGSEKTFTKKEVTDAVYKKYYANGYNDWGKDVKQINKILEGLVTASKIQHSNPKGRSILYKRKDKRTFKITFPNLNTNQDAGSNN